MTTATPLSVNAVDVLALATAPLSGTEIIVVVQNGLMVQTPVSTIGGAVALSGRTAKTTPVTMVNSDGTVNVNLTIPGAVTVNGAASRTPWQAYTIKDAAGTSSTYPITYTPSSGTIDGLSSLQIQNNYDSLTIYSDGINEFTK